MIAITLSVNIKPSSGLSGGPATLTITFGDPSEAYDGIFTLTINGTEYFITFGDENTSNVGTYDLEGGEIFLSSGTTIANNFYNYIVNNFSSSLIVSFNYSNFVTLTTVATSNASLSAVCSLPIFPNVPLGGTTSYLKLANNTDFLLLADNSKLILN